MKCTSEDLRFHYREHRTVVLPSYQGLGFGSRIADAISEYMALHGYRMQSKTAHPRYGRYRDNSPLWNALGTNHNTAKRIKWTSKNKKRSKSISDPDEKAKMYYSHVYKLPFQRNNDEQNYLESRVIVKRKYEKHSK
eukprot:159602_1